MSLRQDVLAWIGQIERATGSRPHTLVVPARLADQVRATVGDLLTVQAVEQTTR